MEWWAMGRKATTGGSSLLMGLLRVEKVEGEGGFEEGGRLELRCCEWIGGGFYTAAVGEVELFSAVISGGGTMWVVLTYMDFM
jgi:hypothetical protein